MSDRAAPLLAQRVAYGGNAASRRREGGRVRTGQPSLDARSRSGLDRCVLCV